METKVTFRVLGVDFDDDHALEKITANLDDLSWAMIDGTTWATLVVDYGDVVSKAIETARRIEHALPGSRVDQLDEELVAIPDISARTKIHRETIRSWITGTRGPGGFPMHRASLGGGDRGSMKIWRWADVNRWLDQTYSLGDGFSYPTDAQFAEISSYLAGALPMTFALMQSGGIIAGFTAARNLETRTSSVLAMDAHTPWTAGPTNYTLRTGASQ